jgi:hypothetical protein
VTRIQQAQSVSRMLCDRTQSAVCWGAACDLCLRVCCGGSESSAPAAVHALSVACGWAAGLPPAAHPFCAPDVPEALGHCGGASCAGRLQAHFHGVEGIPAGHVDSTSEHTAHKLPRCWGPCCAVSTCGCGAAAAAAATTVQSEHTAARRQQCWEDAEAVWPGGGLTRHSHGCFFLGGCAVRECCCCCCCCLLVGTARQQPVWRLVGVLMTVMVWNGRWENVSILLTLAVANHRLVTTHPAARTKAPTTPGNVL